MASAAKAKGQRRGHGTVATNAFGDLVESRIAKLEMSSAEFAEKLADAGFKRKPGRPTKLPPYEALRTYAGVLGLHLTALRRAYLASGGTLPKGKQPKKRKGPADNVQIDPQMMVSLDELEGAVAGLREMQNIFGGPDLLSIQQLATILQWIRKRTDAS